MNKVLIYTAQTSPRLTYTLDFLLDSLLGLTYQLTSDKEVFSQDKGPKFSYATEPLGDELFFDAAALLFETKIQHQPIFFYEHGNLFGLFTGSERSKIPFDLFASTFFLISRYKEYLPNKKDKYDRYRSSQSMNYKAGFLEKPMVNYYALELKRILGEAYPALVFKQNKFEYLATFDVDMAYSYLEKGWVTNLGGFVRSIMFSDFKDVRERFRVLTKGKRDPYDNFDYICEVCKRFGSRTMFFFLLGDRSRFDKNIPHTNEKFRDLIKGIAAKTDVGIHLSYKSHISDSLMEEEKERLEEITGQKIFRNRFHFLRFQTPDSYKRLIKIGITEDHSMAYAPRPGFRAGTCSPFYYFDLRANKATELKIHPFAFMDTTFVTYNKVFPIEAQERILQIMKYVKEVEGPFIGLWHNSSFTEKDEWRGWKAVFEAVAHEARKLTDTP